MILAAPGRLGTLSAAVGGVLVLFSFQVIPVLVGGADGARTGRQVAVASGQLGQLGLFWLAPAAAMVLLARAIGGAVLGARADGITMVVSGLAALGHVLALKLLQRPAGAATTYAAGIDPASALGPAYWLSLGGFLVALAGAVLDWWSQLPALSPVRSWSVIAGTAAGVVLGTVIASTILSAHLDATRRTVVLLAAEGAAPETVLATGPREPDPLGSGDIPGDTEHLYGGTFGRAPCDRDAIAAARLPGGWPPITELTPVRLRADTRVTAHRFVGDHVLPYQAVLQSGTAILVDPHGIPRIRCTDAIPLAPPRGSPNDYLDPRWPGFDPAAVITVTPSAHDIRQFGLTGAGHSFRRPPGTTGDRDIDQIPAQAFIDGTYQLDGKQISCNLLSCEKAATRRLTVTVTNCPTRCQISSGDWSGTLDLVRANDNWHTSGTPTSPFYCGETPNTTTFSLDLHPTSGAVLNGLWTADRLEGTYSKNSPPTTCRGGELSWSITAARK